MDESLLFSIIRYISRAGNAALVYFLPMDPLVKTICVVSMACPCAAIMPMVVEQYGGVGAEKASDITLLTTFFSMGALPLSIWLSGILF